ncbi:MAG: CPBP family intramembrane metalloprotease [Oscillospiraceae bacterium]|nr:CPBP family intramembrane metalloprotease [Oscillospiraceae bacterium]
MDQTMNYTPRTDMFSVSQPERRAIKKQYSETFMVLIAEYFAITIIAMIIFHVMEEYGYVFRHNDAGQPIMDWQYSLAGSLPSIIMCILIFAVDRRIAKNPMSEYLRTDRMGGSFMPLMLAVCMVGYVVAMLIELGLIQGFALFDMQPLSADYDFDTDLTPAFLAQEVLTTIVLAPIAEELMFRGVVLRRLCKVDQTFGIFMSALVFGLMHGNILQTVLGFTIGIVFAYADIKAGSILPSIIGHMFLNGSASLSSFVEYFFGEDVSSTVWVCMLALYFIIGLIVFLVLLFGKKIKFPENTEYHRRRALPIAMTCISFWIMIVVYIVDVISACGPLVETAE